MDWSNVDEYSNSIWSSKHLTNKLLKSEQARLMDKYKGRLAPILRKKKLLGVIEGTSSRPKENE